MQSETEELESLVETQDSLPTGKFNPQYSYMVGIVKKRSTNNNAVPEWEWVHSCTGKAIIDKGAENINEFWEKNPFRHQAKQFQQHWNKVWQIFEVRPDGRQHYMSKGSFHNEQELQKADIAKAKAAQIKSARKSVQSSALSDSDKHHAPQSPPLDGHTALGKSHNLVQQLNDIIEGQKAKMAALEEQSSDIRRMYESRINSLEADLMAAKSNHDDFLRQRDEAYDKLRDAVIERSAAVSDLAAEKEKHAYFIQLMEKRHADEKESIEQAGVIAGQSALNDKIAEMKSPGMEALSGIMDFASAPPIQDGIAALLKNLATRIIAPKNETVIARESALQLPAAAAAAAQQQPPAANSLHQLMEQAAALNQQIAALAQQQQQQQPAPPQDKLATISDDFAEAVS